MASGYLSTPTPPLVKLLDCSPNDSSHMKFQPCLLDYLYSNEDYYYYFREYFNEHSEKVNYKYIIYA